MSTLPPKSLLNLPRILTYRLARLQAKLNAQASDLVERHCGLSLSQWRIIAVLSDPEVNTQKDVMKAVGLDKGQISRTIKQLSAKNLITIAPDRNDHRVQQLNVTEDGYDILNKMAPIMSQRQEYLKDGFSEEELKAFIDFVDRLERKAHKLNIEDDVNE